MTFNLYWLQCGGCGGDTWSLFNAETPSIIELLNFFDIELLWHPSLSVNRIRNQLQINESLLAGEIPLDILCIEGSILRGPGGTGRYDEISGRPKKDLVASLAKQARYILAVGTCASFGGIGVNSEIEATGLQFIKNPPFWSLIN